MAAPSRAPSLLALAAQRAPTCRASRQGVKAVDEVRLLAGMRAVAERALAELKQYGKTAAANRLRAALQRGSETAIASAIDNAAEVLEGYGLELEGDDLPAPPEPPGLELGELEHARAKRIALHVSDWRTQFGARRIERREWATAFRAIYEGPAAERAWERLRQSMLALGVPFTTGCPVSDRGDIGWVWISLGPAADLWVNAVLGGGNA